MAETRSLPVIEEEEIGDEFYEKIEAPKFVDFTKVDSHRPNDRYWFCLRVGCDQKHEEELDPEAIYKNFVLRVMAARSPNVKLRKALNKKEASANLKCPHSVPAKSSKSRVSRLALISSMSKNMIEKNGKVGALSKVSVTPNAKVKQSSAMAKALTTPRNQKKVSNLDHFRTVPSKKAMSVVVPKNKVLVAKALVFHSPKKAVKTKSSIELKTPVKALCSAMKKLELNGAKKNEEGSKKPLETADSRKQFRGRMVKSRVFDASYSNRGKGQETNSMKCLKEKKKAKDLQKCLGPQLHDGTDNDSSDMEIDEKSRAGSLDKYPQSSTSSDACRGDNNSLPSSEEAENNTSQGCENKGRRNPVQEQGKTPEAMKINDKQNAFSLSDDKENVGEINDNDEKENASAPDENRSLNIQNNHQKKTIISNTLEDSRKMEKKSRSTAPSSQIIKYRKLKPTNPKPFKLRTDERGILKEANLEKNAMLPLKDASAKGSKAIRKHQNVNQRIETCLGQSEHDTDYYDDCEERSDQETREDQSGRIRNSGFDKSDGKVKCKLSATSLTRNADLKPQKPINLAERLEHRDEDAKKLEEKLERKPQLMQSKIVRPRGSLSRKKETILLATPSNLSVINEKSSNIVRPKGEVAKLCNNGAFPRTKATGATSRPHSRGRTRAPTVPKEPNFHSLHVPKSCTRKLT